MCYQVSFHENINIFIPIRFKKYIPIRFKNVKYLKAILRNGQESLTWMIFQRFSIN